MYETRNLLGMYFQLHYKVESIRDIAKYVKKSEQVRTNVKKFENA